MPTKPFTITLRPDLVAKVGGMLEPFVEAAAIVVRDEIVAVMEESDPTGRMYLIPGTKRKYTASAPGEPPAIREGVYREFWKSTPAVRQGKRVVAAVFNDLRVEGGVPLWEILEFGTLDGKLKPRPHVGPAIERALPLIDALAKRSSS